MDNRKILYNGILTPDGTILHSIHRHDFKTHTDKNGEQYMVDGGGDYIRRSVNTIPYTDLTILDDGLHETRRRLVMWGQNYDKDMNRLPETIFRPIKELDIDHLYNILITQKQLPKFYFDIISDEIIHKENEYYGK